MLIVLLQVSDAIFSLKIINKEAFSSFLNCIQHPIKQHTDFFSFFLILLEIFLPIIMISKRFKITIFFWTIIDFFMMRRGFDSKKRI